MPAASRLTIVGAVVAALLLGACGSSGSGASSTGPARESVKTGVERPFSQTRESTRSQSGRERRRPVGGLCQSQLGGLVGSMDSLRRRLAVGVTYDQYLNEIHGIRSTYHAVPAGEVEIDCVDAVAVPAEKAFNRYIQAANAWGACVSELGCGSAQVEPVLQQRWRAASHFLAEAEHGLRLAS